MDAAVKILVTGKGGSGAWAVRGDQLGAAIGATVKPMAEIADFLAHDLAIVVKRTPRRLMECLRQSGSSWVFDLVDFYPQPEVSGWAREYCIAWVHAAIRKLRPTAIIWPNDKMREDCDLGHPGVVIPHHHRPEIKINPVREFVEKIGYEGGEQYLAEWEPALKRECAKRGIEFVKNPENLADLDIVVAFRGGQWNGYAQENWKSAIKLANAHGSGTPFIGFPEAGYLEQASGAEYWARHRSDIGMCFDWLADQGKREQISDIFRRKAYNLDCAACDLNAFLKGFL